MNSKDIERIVRVLSNQGKYYGEDPEVSTALLKIKEKYQEYRLMYDFETAAVKARSEWLAQELSSLHCSVDVSLLDSTG
jgi:hypothetical protein